MDKKSNYQLSERDLDIRSDLEFVDSLLKEQRLEVEPQARGVILDLAYTLARDKLVEAQRFAKLANRSNVSVEDLEMANLERTEELSRRPIHQPVKSLVPSQPSLPTPTVSRGLMLPTWRQCQVGIMAELKDKGAETLPANPRTGLPPNPVTASASVPGLNSGSNSMLATGSSNPGRNTSNPIARPAGSNMNPPDNFSKPTFVAPSSRADHQNAMRNHSTPRVYANNSTAGYVSDSSLCFTARYPGGVHSAVKKPRMHQ
ncbi:uncharacterized protein LOC6555987 [Drosophila erecta]|uniref:Uncharacterized protein n=1 Tax=Drosophila erecta TaxID=7220 RepID=B3PA58_DROER|nr:uncharacterized protein LOC6555987 [Drosophila erecta]EDV45289.1 uncharacterized protein Dere_GG13087 [Drosophila erecta]